MTIPGVTRANLISSILSLKSEVDRLINELGLYIGEDGRLTSIRGIHPDLLSGYDFQLVTGTPGTSGNLVEWNADGDAVDSGDASADLVKDGDSAGGSLAGTYPNPTLAADAVDALTEIAAALKSGADATLVTGTAGSANTLLKWNADGDAVAGSTTEAATGQVEINAGTENAPLKVVSTDQHSIIAMEDGTTANIVGPGADGDDLVFWSTARLATLKSTGEMGIGIASPGARLDVDQSSATGAIPVLRLDQADVSEEMIEFETTIGTGNAIEAIGAKTLTTTHFIKVTIPGGLTRYIPVGTIA